MKKLFLVFVLALFTAQFSQAQWEPEVRLTNDPDSSLTTYFKKCIAAIDDIVHVVWYDKRDGNWEIYYKRSTDGGITWEADVRLTNDDSGSYYPVIEASGTDVHVAWQDYRDGNSEIYYKRSLDGGLSWGTDTRLTDYTGYSRLPSISVSGSVVHVVWHDTRDGNYEIYYKRSTDGGLSWGADKRLTDDDGGSIASSIAASGTNVHVVWNDWRDGNGEIYYKSSTDEGANWGPDTRLTNNTSTSNTPSIAGAGTELHVVWMVWEGSGAEIYYKRSQDGGITWGDDTRLTYEIGSYSYNPNIAVSGPVLHVVWYDNREWNYHIYYKRSDDGGENWGEDTLISGNGVMSSKGSSVAVSGSMVHVVWYDDRDGNYEIYYKRDPTGGFPVGINNELTGNSGQSVSIYPNPASTILNISFSSPSDEAITLRFMDMSGKRLKTYNFAAVEGMNQYTINLDDFQNGFYFIELTDGTNRYFQKVIIN